MIQKVLKVGSSAAVIIPRKSLEELGLKIGDEVSVDIDRKKKTVLISQQVSKIEKEIIDWTDKFINKYRPALEALARK